MIDPAIGWFEMAQIPNTTAADIADITEKTWFTRYPLPQRILFDHGNKFMAESSNMCQNDYGLKRKPIPTSNFQSNLIIVQDALSFWRDTYRAYSPSTVRLERPSLNSPQRV